MKAQRFEITHTTVYDYDAPVTFWHHFMRLSPRPLSRQQRLAHEIEMDPPPAILSQRLDYFGKDTTFATIDRAHRRLSVTSRSLVAVGPTFIPDAAETPRWEAVRGLCRTDRTASVLEAAEFTFASPLVPVAPPFTEYAAPSFR